MDNKNAEEPIEIKAELLSDDALKGVISSFISREGTDYGHSEQSYENKENRIRKQIQSGHIKIVFDQKSETVSLLTKEDFLKTIRTL